MGGSCCAKSDILPEEYIISIYSSLKIRNFSFQIVYEMVINKNFNSKNLINLPNEKLNFLCFKRILESIFYDIKNPDEIHYNMHKQIFEKLVKFYTKPNGDVSLVEIFTLFLYLVNNSDLEKAKFYYEMHIKEFENIAKFKTGLLNYLKDCLFLLSNICDEYYDHDTPDTLHYYLSTYTQKKVEVFFESSLHKDLGTLKGEGLKLTDLLKEISFIFNLSKLRENYNFYYMEERGDFKSEPIKSELAMYTLTRKSSF